MRRSSQLVGDRQVVGAGLLEVGQHPQGGGSVAHTRANHGLAARTAMRAARSTGIAVDPVGGVGVGAITRSSASVTPAGSALRSISSWS